MPGFLFCIILALNLLCTFSTYAQPVESKNNGKIELQKMMRRIYILDNKKGKFNNKIVFNSKGAISLRSNINQKNILTGQNIAMKNTGFNDRNTLMRIIEPVQLKTREKERIAEVDSEDDKTIKDFSFFPNPIERTQKEISINFNKFESGSDVQMLLFDASGNVMVKQNLKVIAGQNRVTVPTLASGIYYVNINEKNSNYSKAMFVK
ncbi:T9SS type A sorting domain-containing protein [Dyadobacter sp. NIV53]|uniref:T9SS type A sorting domain-containing protein n=1 Tax=Dyadobacter sp. NIV53 TaxID=2861765 RepID=UPI001C87446D|nr:T9SS type A sorting domain-containing protein [Dyadobacter sp. NIV53]